MPVLYVARSAKLSQWGSDVGLSKHIYKVGCTDEPLKPLVEAGWAGETDWTIVKKQEAEGVTEDEVLERLAKKERVIDPAYYPRIKGTPGLFKVLPAHVENHILLARTLAGEPVSRELKLKASDFAAYLIANAQRG